MPHFSIDPDGTDFIVNELDEDGAPIEGRSKSFATLELAESFAALRSRETPEPTDDTPITTSTALPPGEVTLTMPDGRVLSIKSDDNNEIEILVPFGGPFPGGVDRHGDFFDKDTDFKLVGLPDLPRPVVYLHAKNDPTPEALGSAVSYRDADEGRWYRVVLDKAGRRFDHIMKSLRAGTLSSSSQALMSFIRGNETERGTHVTHWPIVELTLIDVPSALKQGLVPANPFARVEFAQARASLKSVGLVLGGGEPDAATRANQPAKRKGIRITGASKMSEDITKAELAALIGDTIDAKEAARAEQETVKAAALEAENTRIAEAVKTALAEHDKSKEEQDENAEEGDEAKRRRLPGGEAPYAAKYAETYKYDNLDFSDMAFMVGVLNANDGSTGLKHSRTSEAALKTLALRAAASEAPETEKVQRAMKMAGISMKADEIMQQDLTSGGDEWVGVAYSNQLWETIRLSAQVATMIPSLEIPQGFESLTIPTEGGDPTFYVVAEATDENSTTKTPDATVTSSIVGTSNVSLTVKKMGARVQFSGELEEDSLIPIVSEIRRRLAVVGGLMMDNVVLNGDTDVSASTNINDIAGTPAATDLFLLANGFRKSALITTALNSRSGGALAVGDFLETLKLMGTAGIDGIDTNASDFIIGPNIYYKALQLPEVVSRDVFVSPVLENGQLTGLYGRRIFVSDMLHFRDSDRLANTSGLVDVDTVANNTTDSLIAVRWDQWRLGFKRRMTMETVRIPRADTTEIVALTRWGLVQRSTEGAAISYNLTV